MTSTNQHHSAMSAISIWLRVVSGVLILFTTVSLVVILIAHRDALDSHLLLGSTPNETTNQTRVAMREDTLTVGDLVLLWGKPIIQRYCETLVMSWPTFHVMSIVPPSRTGKLDYFSSVVSVYFTPHGLPPSLRILKNDTLHGCDGVHRLHPD